MKTWLCVEFVDQVDTAVHWLAKAPIGQTRRLLAIRKEVEGELKNRNHDHDTLCVDSLQPKDYEELDRFSRHFARTWSSAVWR